MTQFFLPSYCSKSFNERRLIHQRGAASLILVSLLLIVMSIVVTFANRSIIFEQKTSANQYRYTLAFEAAEAGLAWGQSMLNTQTYLTASCDVSSNSADRRFKDRYLKIIPETTEIQPWVTAGPAGFPAVAACVFYKESDTIDCSCPDNFKADLNPSIIYTVPNAVAPTNAAGYTPGFAIAFETNSATGTVDLVSYGCTVATNSTTCAGDARAIVRTSIGQVSGLSTPPAAPLTARGNVSIGSAALGVHNPDPNTNGVTINAGGNIDANNLSKFSTIPGTPPYTTLVGNDVSLREKSEDSMFTTFFGMSKTAYKALPATHVLTCTSCTETDVQTAYDAGHRQLWINGELNMNANTTIGSETDPFVMVVNESIHMNGNLQIYGVMYSAATTWDNTGGGGALLRGAAISEGNYTGNGTPDYYYDPLVMRRIRTGSLTFATVPGSWRDF